MIFLKSGPNEIGLIEYYLVGLECYEDFDEVIEELLFMGVKVIRSYDGIFSRASEMVFQSKKFKVMYHEDVGIYSYILEAQSDESKKWLSQILEKIIERFNHK